MRIVPSSKYARLLPLITLMTLVVCAATPRAHSADPVLDDDKDSESSSSQPQTTSSRGNSSGSTRESSGGPKGPERNFYQVLEDVLGDFEYDLKNGNVSGLRDIAIRNVGTSETVPSSFKNHLELLVTERIMKNTKTRVMQCLPCRSKRAILNGDSMVISTTDQNPVELARIAKLGGIANFVDVAFTYHPNGMILAFYIVDAESGSITWSRSYNSETSRANALRRGVDASQMEQARNQTEYAPTVQYRGSVYYLNEPNVGKRASCLGFGFRMMERYDNRKKEVGFEANYIMSTDSLTNPASSSTTNIWSGFNVTMLFMHVWNLIGDEENFHKPRGGVLLGAGGTYTSGYLGGLIRSGYEWRLGKKAAVTGVLGYRPSSTAFIGTSSTTGTSISGLEAGVGVSLLF